MIGKKPSQNLTSTKEVIESSIAIVVETWLRSTTSAERFNSLTIIHNDKTVTKNLNLRDAVN